jgi:hypothetical protein
VSHFLSTSVRSRIDGLPVAVGTALASRPPRRSGRAGFPHPAPRSGHRGTCGDVCHSAYSTRSPGPASSVWKLPNGIALAPPPSLHLLHFGLDRFVRRLRRYYAAVRLPECVHRRRTVTPFPTLTALDCSTAVDRSMADALRLSRLGAHDASVYAQVSDPAECFHPLPKRDGRYCLPCVGTTSALGSCTRISGLNTGPTHPLSTLHERHCCRSRMTWGQSGWLGLLCWGLTPLPSCRF